MEFDFSGGFLCLDFANTLGGSRLNSPSEDMPGYPEMLEWSRQAGLISAEQQQMLSEKSRQAPQETARVYRRAVDLRESFFRIFSTIARDGAPAQADLDILNAELERALPRLRVAQVSDRFEWVWSGDHMELDAMLGPVARSAAELMTSTSLEQVRECESDDCTWLFLDRTKNHSRMWCDMKSCGNRAKVRRYRERHKESLEN